MSYTNAIKPEENLIRIMSSNVLAVQSDAETLIPQATRALSMCAHYLTYQPDFLGLQEVQAHLRCFFADTLAPLYTEAPVDTNGKKNYTPIFYRADKFTLIDSKFFPFFERGLWHYEWALYERKSDARRLIHMNLHYHYSATEARLPEAQLVNEEIKRLESLYPDAAIFVTGDYNCETFTPEFSAMLDGLKMKSGMHLTDDNDGFEVGWHHPDTSEYVGEGAIDHISVTYEKARVVRHRKLKSELLRYSTDHDPVFIDVELI
jgi:endonuclease/exonuclease/phosphatase family metal-dependent hydrolase